MKRADEIKASKAFKALLCRFLDTNHQLYILDIRKRWDILGF
jgi:hypothetical protein